MLSAAKKIAEVLNRLTAERPNLLAVRRDVPSGPRSSRFSIRCVMAGFAISVVLGASPAFALSTLNVNTTSMAVATDGVCSLVEALRAARNRATVNECVISGGSPVVINLQSGATYSIGTPEETDGFSGPSGFLIANEDVTINGNGSTLTQSQGAMRVLMVRSTATLRDLTISGGRATNTATAIGGWGGGIGVIDSAATLNLDNVTLTDNGSAVDGGSILVGYGARLNMHRSAIMGNGSGLYVVRVSVNSTANIANTTLFGPSHALNVGEGSTVWVSNSTLSGNQFALFGPDGNTVRVQNSILNGTCIVGAATLTSTNNAAGASSGCSTTFSLPALWPWSLNGGSTPTMVPKQPNATRNALGACTYQSTGTNPLFSNGSAITVDQRGAARDANCDIGAVEAAGISPSSVASLTVGNFYSQSLTASGAATPFTFAVSSGSLPGGLSMDSAGVISGTPNTAGSFGVDITLSDSAGFKSIANYSIVVNKASQSISFPAQSPGNRSFVSGGQFGVNPPAFASSGLTVSYASTTPGICSVSTAGQVTMLAAGTCTVQASQAGNANFLAASTQSVSVTIGKAGQSLSWGAQAAQTFAPGGMFSIAPLAVSSAGLTPVSYASSTPAVCSVSGTSVSMLATGLCTLTANQAGDTNHFAAAMVTTDVTINKATQTLSWGAQSVQSYSVGGSFSIAPLAVSSAGLTPVTYSSNTPAVCTVTGINVSIVAAGTCTLAAAQAGDANYQAAPVVTVNVTINKAAQSLSWGAQSAQSYSVGGSFSIAPLAVSSAGLASITYGSGTPAVCTVSGTTVSIITAGTCTLTANQAGDANYAAAVQVTSNVNISKASQTLSWGAQPSRVFAPAGSFAIAPLAVSSAGLSGITYGSATSAVCTVSGTTVSMLSSGLCRLTANQTGDANYLAAPAITVDVTIDKAAQTLIWSAQAAQTFSVGGSFAVAPLASSSAGLSGIVYGTSTPAVCTVSGTTVSMLSAGLCTLTATHPGNGDYLAAPMVNNDVTIGKAAQSLSWAVIAAQTFAPGGSFTITPQAVASSGLTAITYASVTPLVCTVSGTTVSILTAGTCRLTAAQAGDSNYQSAPSINQDVVIAKAGQTLTFPAQPARSYASAATFSINPLATASSGLTALVYGSSTPAVCTVAGTTVTIVAAGLCTLTADQAGDGNYNAAAQVSVAVTINLAVQTISFPAPTAKVLGVQPFTVTVSGGTSGNAVLVTSATPTRCTATGINGTLITLLATGTCTLRANQAGNANHAVAAQVEVSFDINASTTVVKLASSSNPARWRQPVTFTIDVVGINVTGEVDVLDGIETLCAKLAVVNGRASCTVGNLAEDGHSIRAYYRGDANNTPAFSDELVQVVSRLGSRQGAWWGGPAENGWGLSIVEHGETLVVGWYFYDSAGKPTWLTVNGCAWDTGGNRCSGALRRAQASWLGAYRADSFVSQEVGSATLAFDEQGALFSYVVNGVAGSKRIMRMDLGGNPYAPFDYSDVWWGGPSENGWGVAAFVAGQSLVGIWYTYDAAGQPTWLLFNGGQQRNPRTFQAYLYRPQGSPFGLPYNAAQHSATHVGEIHFDFDDVRRGTMTYQMEGLLQFKPFLRVPF